MGSGRRVPRCAVEAIVSGHPAENWRGKRTRSLTQGSSLSRRVSIDPRDRPTQTARNSFALDQTEGFVSQRTRWKTRSQRFSARIQFIGLKNESMLPFTSQDQ